MIHVFFVDKVVPLSFQMVVTAARQAGLEERYLYALTDRNAFLRAIRALSKEGRVEGLADKFQDDQERISFQFSIRHLSEKGVDYSRNKIVIFNRNTNQIDCEDRSILELAQNLFNEVRSKMRSADILRFVTRCVKKRKFKQISLRDGVYALPEEAGELIGQLETFFSYLGISFFRLKAGAEAEGSFQQTQLLRAVSEDVSARVKSLKSELNGIVAEGETVSGQILANRRKMLAEDLKQYSSWARSLGSELSKILEVASDAGRVFAQVTIKPRDVLIEEIQRGEEKDPLVLALAEPGKDIRFTPNMFDGHDDSVVFLPPDRGEPKAVLPPAVYVAGDEG